MKAFPVHFKNEAGKKAERARKRVADGTATIVSSIDFNSESREMSVPCVTVRRERMAENI